MKIFLVILISFFPITAINAQNDRKEIDSISKLIENNYVVGDINPGLTLKHLTALYYASRQEGYYEGQMNAVFEEARIYYLNGNFDAALNKINEGIDLAKGHSDYNTLCRILLIYQRVLLQLDHLNASKKILSHAERYNKLVSSYEDQQINKIYILIASADLLALNEKQNKTDEVIRLKRTAYSQSQKIRNSNKLKKVTEVFTLQSLTSSLISGRKISEAKKSGILMDKILLTFPDDAFTIQNLIIKGHLESAMEHHDRALELYMLALNKSKRNNNNFRQYEIYSMIAAAYAETNDFKNSANFSKKYKHLLDSLDLVKKRSGDVNFINRINEKVSDTSEKTKLSENIDIMIILTLIIVVIILVIIHLKVQKTKKTSKEAKSVIDSNDRHDVLLEAAQMVTTSTDNVKTLVFLAKEDINTFQIEFQKAYPSFYKNLKDKYPDLNISDLNFCALIKMNFTIKEIAQFTNSTIRAIEARRQRLYKKMDLKNQNDLYMEISFIN